MFAVSVLCLAALCSLLSSTEAVISAWTNPGIAANKDGSGIATPSIAEDKVPGSTGVTVAATESASATITYAILSQPTSAKVTINSASGLLSLASGKSFDFETEPFYVLTITATAGASTGTATVTLSITDVNDNNPMFRVSQYRLTMTDGATASTAVTTVHATDADAGTTLTYSITAGNTNSVFAIAAPATTGAITVAAGKTVDLAGTGGYTLTVTASDGTKTGTTSVVIADKICSSATTIIAGGITVVFAMVALMF